MSDGDKPGDEGIILCPCCGAQIIVSIALLQEAVGHQLDARLDDLRKRTADTKPHHRRRWPT